MRYFKFRWVQSLHPDLDHPDWGDSWWYHEFGADGYARRQIMLYDNGVRVRYDLEYTADEFGEIYADVPLGELNLAMGEEIGAAEFAGVWQTGPWNNYAD